MNEIPRTACAGRSEQIHKPHNAESHPPTPLASFRAEKETVFRCPFSLPPDCLRGQRLGPSMTAHTGSGEPSVPVGLGETLAELGTKATMRAEEAPLAQLST